MKTLLMSFAVGLLVGVVYGVIRVKSPAPPIVALLGLLGMVLGEQAGGLLRTKPHTKNVQSGNVSSAHIVAERPPMNTDEVQQEPPNLQSVVSSIDECEIRVAGGL
jgi:XapX domain-containing protein